MRMQKHILLLAAPTHQTIVAFHIADSIEISRSAAAATRTIIRTVHSLETGTTTLWSPETITTTMLRTLWAAASHAAMCLSGEQNPWQRLSQRVAVRKPPPTALR